ncbi:hypothetical protein NDU88_001832 [Pleurodeles waltl]|uniref:Uncharacterized protein n=1 Tax=Pleurodeles waltl TaxID=8319 RepID=A0AAV7SD99_PLEWA|nr:hypothetical protein NDU88_001832 [Pleurodeles waltl]
MPPLSPSQCPRAGLCEERAAPDPPILIDWDARWGEVSAGLPVPHRHTGSRSTVVGVGRRPAQAAHPVPAAACLPTRGRGFEREREEGLQASSQSGRHQVAHGT